MQYVATRCWQHVGQLVSNSAEPAETVWAESKSSRWQLQLASLMYVVRTNSKELFTPLRVNGTSADAEQTKGDTDSLVDVSDKASAR